MFVNLFQNGMIALLLLGGMFICAVVLIIHYFRLLKVKSANAPVSQSAQSPISVVIATRNEHEQLRLNLPFFLEQNHVNFEVVVVIDDSDKGLDYIVKEFEKQYSNLKIVSFEWSRNFFLDQKFAESIGIKSATHDRILLTNINTRPASPEWVTRMSNALSGEKKIVIGYHTPKSKSTFSNSFIRYETFIYILRYMRAVLAGKTFTADRKNVAFERSLFYATKGVARFYNVNTGDEDMFVNKAATSTNTVLEIHPNSFVKGQEPLSFNDWFEKKIRHRVVSKEFKSYNKLGLMIYDLFTSLFYIFFFLTVVCFFLPSMQRLITSTDLWILGGGIFVLKNLIQLLVLKKVSKTFKEHVSLLLIPFFEIVSLALYPILLFIGLFTKRITWK